MKIVVGLGNPGPRYRGTRHNIGFEVLAELSRRHGSPPVAEKFEAEISELFLGGEKMVLFAPNTYMNLSGRAVRKCYDFFQPSLDDLVVVCDDMNLDVGRLRWRRKGSAGGQKGLADVLLRLGSQEIPRLRVGIGRPPARIDPVDFVLTRFSAEERQIVDAAVRDAADSIEFWIDNGIENTMNRFNAEKE